MLNAPPLVVPGSTMSVLPGPQPVSASRLLAPAAPATRLTLRGVDGLDGANSRTLLIDATVVVSSAPDFPSSPVVLAIAPPDRMTSARTKSGPAVEFVEPTANVPPATVMVLACFGSPFLNPSALRISPPPEKG